RSFRPLIAARVLARYSGGLERSCEVTPDDSCRKVAPSADVPASSIDWPRTSGVEAANSLTEPQAAARANAGMNSRIFFFIRIVLQFQGSVSKPFRHRARQIWQRGSIHGVFRVHRLTGRE